MSQVPPPMSAPPMGYQTPPPGKPNMMALIAMILGIASFVLCWIPLGPVSLGLFLAIGAIVVAFLARKKIAAGEQTGSSMATAGLILGGVNILIQIILIILAVVFGTALMGWGNRMIKEAERQQQQQQIEQTDTGVQTTDPATPTTSEVP